MTAIPQDVRSPIQQSRWVHAKNTGFETIPAHGVCEVFVNDVDKNDGVDTLEVKRPTANGVPECVINSLVPIEPGGYGWVTRDFPAYASGIDLVVGDMAGSKKDSFDLAKGFPGFLVVGDGPDAASSGSALEAAYYRVVEMWEPLARATVEWDLSCDDEKATLSASWVSRTDLAIADARNIYKLKAGAGTQVALQWDGKGKDENDEENGCWVVLQVEDICPSSSSSTSSSSSLPSSSSSSTSSSSFSSSSSSSSSLSSSSSTSSSSSSSTSSSSSSSSSSSISCTSTPCACDCPFEADIVTNVQCINGSIVVTKKKLRVCGQNVCVELV